MNISIILITYIAERYYYGIILLVTNFIVEIVFESSVIHET